MKKLFAVLEKQHPGCEVIDIRFTLNVRDIDNNEPMYSVAEFDTLLADAIENAEEMDISTMF